MRRRDLQQRGTFNLRRYRTPVACALSTLLLACNAKRITKGGLEIVIRTDLHAPSEYDEIHLVIWQETAPNVWGTPKIDNTFRIAADGTGPDPDAGTFTLPASFAITAGTSPDQNARIDVTGISRGPNGGPKVLREVVVQVPTDRVALLDVWLAESCYGQLEVTDGGAVTPACDASESCQPATGACGASAIDAGSLTTSTANPIALDASPPDLGLDASHGDASADAAVDATLDATVDATVDAPFDAPLDGGADTSATCLGGITCDGGCTLGRCVTTLAAGRTTANEIGMTATDVYWSDDNSGTLCSVPRGGGEPTTLVATHDAPLAFAVSNDTLYWAPMVADAAVTATPLGGGPPTVISTGDDTPTRFSLSNAHLAWIDNQYAQPLIRVATADASGPPVAFTSTTEVWAVIVNDSTVFWTAPAGGGVMAAPLDGGAAVMVIPQTLNVLELTTDGTHLFWTAASSPQAGGTTLLSSLLDGGNVTTLASGRSPVGGLAVDDASVYWTEQLSSGDGSATAIPGLIMKVPITGGPTITLAADQATPSGIVVDDTSVYWTNFGIGDVALQGSALMKLTPK